MNAQINMNNIALGTCANISTSDKFKFIPLLDAAGFNKHVDNLIGQQKDFIYLLDKCFEKQQNAIIRITGCAGTGKTFTVINTSHFLNCHVLKLTPTNELANQINGCTIHSALRLDWQPGSILDSVTQEIEQLEYDPEYISKSLLASQEIVLNCNCFPNMVIIDEVGMIPFWLIHKIIQYFFQTFSPIIIILMGDRYQLRPVRCNFNIFNTNMPDLTFHDLDFSESNKRFEPSYKIIMDKLVSLIRLGEVQNDFEKVYDFIKMTFNQIDYMTETLMNRASQILAYKNATVDLYNQQYLSLGPKIHIPQIIDNIAYLDNKISLKPNCNIITTYKTNIPKGTRLIFEYHDAKEDALVCWLKKEKHCIYRNQSDGHFPVALAFATTVHKYQGSTIENDIIIDFDYNDNVYFMYTALSRVRSLLQIIGILHIK